jgi:hypothetical protein
LPTASLAVSRHPESGSTQQNERRTLTTVNAPRCLRAYKSFPRRNWMTTLGGHVEDAHWSRLISWKEMNDGRYEQVTCYIPDRGFGGRVCVACLGPTKHTANAIKLD